MEGKYSREISKLDLILQDIDRFENKLSQEIARSLKINISEKSVD
jgi:predicted metalloenzyme YecM